MNWKIKALLQQIFSHLPLGENINYALQRYCTRSLPTRSEKYPAIVSFARDHFRAYERWGGTTIDRAVFYEFGAGWDLLIPLVFYSLGVQTQVLVDIRNLARPFLVNHVIRTLQAIGPELGLTRIPAGETRGGRGFVPSLRESFGIHYRAPCNAAHTGLPSKSVDCITSTNTMEHIPPESLRSILAECHRILRDDGIMSHRIDYVDHFSYADRRVSPQAFLRYPEHKWKFYNPPLHYQNRLRHSDYLGLFLAAGFVVVSDGPAEVAPDDLRRVASMPVADHFAAYDKHDLAIPSAHIVLQKREGS